MTRGKRTGGSLLGHVETPKKLNPEVGVDHVVHILPVGGHRTGGAELAVELDTILAEDVPGDPNLPPVPRLDHHVVVATGLLEPAVVLVPAVALLSVPVILQEDHDVPGGEDDVSIVKILSNSVTRHDVTLKLHKLRSILCGTLNTCSIQLILQYIYLYLQQDAVFIGSDCIDSNFDFLSAL